MRRALLASLTTTAALLAGTLYTAAQVQPNGTPSTQPQQQELVAPRSEQQPANPQQGTIGQGQRPAPQTPKERQDQLPLQPGGHPANEPPQGKGEN